MDDNSTPEPDGPVDRLREAWYRHVSSSTELFDRLAGRHREKHRRYHTITHVDAVVTDVVSLANSESVDDLGVIVASALYHDAIYEPESPANERASARLARRDLTKLGWSPDRVEVVATMVEGTKQHAAPHDTDTAVLFDADLAVLGGDADSYRIYCAAVRSEYRHVDDDDWLTGRAEVLQRFLDRSPIYATETGRQRWEVAARANLGAELAELGS